MILNKITDLRVFCDHCHNEMCRKTFLDEHRNSCVFPCPFGCGTNVSLSTLENHCKGGSCTGYIMKCPASEPPLSCAWSGFGGPLYKKHIEECVLIKLVPYVQITQETIRKLQETVGSQQEMIRSQQEMTRNLQEMVGSQQEMIRSQQKTIKNLEETVTRHEHAIEELKKNTVPVAPVVSKSYVPCDSLSGDPRIVIGSRVIIHKHRIVDGSDNWNDEMDQYVGKVGVVDRWYDGRDHGCRDAYLIVDGKKAGGWVFRVRDLEFIS